MDAQKSQNVDLTKKKLQCRAQLAAQHMNANVSIYYVKNNVKNRLCNVQFALKSNVIYSYKMSSFRRSNSLKTIG